MNIDQINIVVDHALRSWDIPGIAIGISNEQKILFEKYVGVRHILRKEQVTEKSVFCIASIGKVFVATAILRLIEENLLEKKGYVKDYIDEFKFIDNNYKKITIEMLLSHRSGLPDYDMETYLTMINNPKMSFKDIIIMHSTADIKNPGEEYLYSNFGYDILGYLISVITNMPFEEYIETFVFRPLKMNHSTFKNPNQLQNLAIPHLRIPKLVPINHPLYNMIDAPSSFMHTTVRDILRYFHNYHEVIKQSSFNYFTDKISVRNYPPFYMFSGRGINIGEMNGNTVLSHGGLGFGSSAFLMYFPSLGVTACICSNQESYFVELIAKEIAKVITGGTPQKIRSSYINTIISNKLSSSDENYEDVKEDLTNILYQLMIYNDSKELNNFVKKYKKIFPEENLSWCAHFFETNNKDI